MMPAKFSIVIVTVALLCACVTDEEPQINAQTEVQKNYAVNTYVELGVDFMQKGEYALAEKRFLQARELAPKSSLVHWTYALLQEKMELPKKAESSFKKAIKLDKRSGGAQNAYGAFLCRQDRINEALAAFDAAIKNTFYQDILNANINAGDCLSQNQRYEEAKGYLNAALDVNEDSAKANYLLAKVYYFEERYALSSVIRNRISTEASNNPGVLWLCVVTERQLGNRSAEAICHKNLIRNFPTSKEAESI